MTVPETPPEWALGDPGLDTSGMAVIGPLKLALAAHAELVAPLFDSADVTAAELDVLLKLRLGPRPTIAVTVARLLGRSPAAVSKTLAKLEARGLVTREPNPADRRAALVRLTDEGRRVVDELFPRQVALESATLGRLDEDGRAELVRALELLVRTLRAGPAG